MPVAQAKCGNQAVNRLADGSAPLPERPEISGGRNSQFLTTSLKNFELAKIVQNLRERLLTSDTLKNLAKNQIGQSEALPPKLTIKVIGLAIRQSMQIVNPHRSINDHHRPLLRKSPKARTIQITVPPHSSSKAPNGGLRPSLYQQPQPRFYDSPLGPRSATPHCLLHQAVVDIDVGSHLFS